VFNRDDTVGALGQRRTSHDRDGLLVREYARGRCAGGDFADDFKINRNLRGLASADRISVHKRPIEWGIIAIGANVFREHEPVGMLQRHLDHAR